MSKMDGLRAMREARFHEAASRTTTKPTIRELGGQRPRRTAETPAVDKADETSALCGHRAISGRTCTRALGHASKSHRYA